MKIISVTGCIGSGKSTLCEALSQELDAPIIREEFSLNPYLSIYYSNRETYALANQLWFLMKRYEQITVGLFNKNFKYAIQDQTLAAFGCIFPEFFYQRGYLTKEEFSTLQTLYSALKNRLPAYDELTICLEPPITALLKRVSQRGREYEKSIDSSYLSGLTSQYKHFYENRRENLITFDSDRMSAEEMTEKIRKEYL